MARWRPMTVTSTPTSRHFPISAGIFFGLGLGGSFDGIVLHQVLQWHHMVSSWYPVNTIENLELNTRWDGIFHSTTYLFVLIGLFLLWRTAHRRHLFWSSKLLIGTMLRRQRASHAIPSMGMHRKRRARLLRRPDKPSRRMIAFLPIAATPARSERAEVTST
jgi:predicted membrane protein DUF2243